MWKKASQDFRNNVVAKALCRAWLGMLINRSNGMCCQLDEQISTGMGSESHMEEI